MDLDDLPVGRVLTRREALAVLGASGALFFLGCSDSEATTDPGETGACVVRPELTEGPYYVDEELNRSDIRSDPVGRQRAAGALLALTFNVSRAGGNVCEPLAGAIVDVWHCDAEGVYSDVSDGGFNTVGRKFLRGYQVTDSDGIARFTTIYPGLVSGPRRAHPLQGPLRLRRRSSAYEFTSQLFFDDALTDQVHAAAPYSAKGQRDTRNSDDGIYGQGGSQLVLNTTQTSDGYAAVFDIALESV